MITIKYSYSKSKYVAEDAAGNVLESYNTLSGAIADVNASGEAYEITEEDQDIDSLG